MLELLSHPRRHLAWVGGGGVVLRNGDRLELFDGAGYPVRQVAIANLVDFGCVGTAIWAVAAAPSRIVRIDPKTGEETTTLLEAVASEGRLVASTIAPGTAVWATSEAAILLAERGGEIAEIARHVADLALPVARERYVIGVGSSIRLLRSSSEVWRTSLSGVVSARIGGVTSEGRTVVVALRDRDEPQSRLVCLGLRDAVVQLDVVVKQLGDLQVAARRAAALVIGPTRHMTLLDLRFGKVLQDLGAHADLTDLAIDEFAQNAVILEGTSARPGPSLVSLAQLAERRAPEEPAAEATSDVAVEDPREADAPSPVSLVPDDAPEPAVDAHVVLAAFGAPPPALPRLPPEAIVLVTDARMRLVGTWAERAIAEAWDSGRLGFPAAGGLPHEPEVRGILEQGRGRAQDRLRAAEAHIAAQDAIVARLLAQCEGRAHPLDVLAAEFALSPAAIDILQVIAAPTHMGELARLFAILSGDSARSICDELLVSQVLASRVGRAELARELDSDRPLLRYGLVIQGESLTRPFAPLRVDPLVARAFRGHSVDDPTDEQVRLGPPALGLDELHLASGQLADMVARLSATRTTPLRLVVRGRIGSGRRTLIAALAARAGRRIGLIDLASLGATTEARLDALAATLRRSVLRGWVPCVEGFEVVGSDDVASRDRLKQIFRRHPGPIALRLAWDAQPPVEPGYESIDLPVLSEKKRAQIWKLELERAGLHVQDPNELASRFRSGPGVVRRACEEIAASLRSGELGTDVTDYLDRRLRQYLETRLAAIAPRVTRTARWSDVVLPEDVIDSLVELVARVRHRATVYDLWGYDRKMTTSRGVVALFQGSPGTGKTMVAGVIARELGLDLYRIDLSRIMSKWIGETEKNLAAVFDAAEDGQSLLLFDEADALFSRRTQVRTSNDRLANLEVNYLLQRLDTFEGMAILTTNFGGSIDPAFSRRLTLRLTFPFPDDDMRERLWRAHIPDLVPHDGTFDLAGLSRRYRLSGGYIRNAALRAAFLAADEGALLSQQHLERAIRLEFREIGKLADSGTLE